MRDVDGKEATSLERARRVPAAAAASTAACLGASSPSFLRGLLSRGSERLLGGDLERRSNLEARFGSGSVWSKRERFAVRRSESSIAQCRLLGSFLEFGQIPEKQQ